MVYKINSLDDSANPGDGKITYRECALALPVTSPYKIPGGRPRYCVFDVSGAIELQSQAWISTPKIYIAGQTSPGGIEFRLGAGYNPVDSLIDTRRGGNDMILRHVRVRTGEHPNRTSDNGDPIRLQSTRNQIIDHVSSMFGTDESLDMQCDNCTVQWSIIGPNVCGNAGHTASFHCKTLFFKPAGNVTVAYNLSQHGAQRGLNLSVGTHPPQAGVTAQGDVLHNVVYHFVDEGGLLSNQHASSYVNYIGNTYLRGPRYAASASNGNYFPVLYTNAANYPRGFNIYYKDNVTPRNRIAGQFGSSTTDPFRDAVGFFKGTAPGSVCGLTASGQQDCSTTGLQVVQNQNLAIAPGVNGRQFEPWMITNPEQGMRDVLAYAGADLCRDGQCRDNVDAMYVEDVRTCDRAPYLFASNWPSRVSQAGGYAQLSPTGGPKADRDNDGMPDEWEAMFDSTDPNVWDANDDADGDGYPNIEEYLNFLAKDHERYRNIYGSGKGSLPAYNCGRPQF